MPCAFWTSGLCPCQWALLLLPYPRLSPFVWTIPLSTEQRFFGLTLSFFLDPFLRSRDITCVHALTCSHMDSLGTGGPWAVGSISFNRLGCTHLWQSVLECWQHLNLGIGASIYPILNHCNNKCSCVLCEGIALPQYINIYFIYIYIYLLYLRIFYMERTVGSNRIKVLQSLQLSTV